MTSFALAEAYGGRRQDRAVRQGGHHPIGQRGQGSLDRLDGLGIDPVRDHRNGLRVLDPELGERPLGGGSDLVRRPVPAMDDQDDGCAQVRGDLGVERQLGAGGDVGVVRSEDQDHREPVGELAEAFDDDVEGLVGVLAGRLVGDPQSFLVGLVDPGLVEQQLHDDVSPRGDVAERPEHPDRADFPGQRVQQSEGHGGLARLSLG